MRPRQASNRPTHAWRGSTALAVMLIGVVAHGQTPLPIIHNGPFEPVAIETLPPLRPHSSVSVPDTLPPVNTLPVAVPASEPARTPPLRAPAPIPKPPVATNPTQAPVPAKAAVIVNASRLPAPTSAKTAVRSVLHQPPAPSGKVVLISLDAVLRLAQDQNNQIRIAREKLHGAHIEQELAGKYWLPDLTAGVGYWRHEGGIQDFDGKLVESSYGSVFAGMEVRGKFDIRETVYQRLDAERKVWQQQGELSRLTSEQLLEAASTYVDMMAALSAEAIALEAETKLRDLLEQARNLAKVDPGLQIEVARVESELGNQQILTRRLREGATAAAAKLIYLLGLDPQSELVPVEQQMVAFHLLDLPSDTQAIVEIALRNGPGLRELEGILGILSETRQQGFSTANLLPTLEVKMLEGGFGAGPDAHLDWANRWDLGIQARWNLTEFLGSRQRKRLADSKIHQAHLTSQDAMAKITLGVHEAAEAQRSGQEQMALAARQIKHAEEAFRLSDMRLRQNIKGRSPSEVLLAIRALAGARLGYLHALRDFDKAQIRLFVLTGGCQSGLPPTTAH